MSNGHRVHAVRPLIVSFDDGPYAGARLVFRGFTVGEFLRLQKGDMEVDDIITFLGSKLREWNLDDEEGEPLPANEEGLRATSSEFAVDLFGRLTLAIGGVPAPLDEPSSNGNGSEVESIPMETL